ncbi:anaerobic ribonucleoside-triphosphate reductase [Eggerthella sinensis]|jgi:hypothetical protein|uniref:Uncharacterized protein n=1 Tax=Eggerthella sinensis TaxID=242230 RepID=A0A3N0IP77_9ACTN|nr:anaerobic ribonucleoside-triphosphate reductase [Eggerthella sinensis]RDB67587.1 hypothetical protein C1876_12945 [Eggerthella sinensis]RNM38801.1 hypothetical protein DMP09_17275 [Eggerthella sinensis]
MEAVLDTAHAMGDMVVNDRVMVDGVNVLVGYTNENDMHVNEDEIRAYLKRGALQHPNSAVTGLALLVDGEDVGIRYELAPVPFDRIRRITGYLVGTMDRWNDAKTSEEADRVKHGVYREDKAFSCSNGC